MWRIPPWRSFERRFLRYSPRVSGLYRATRGARRMWFDGVALNARRHEFTKIKNA